MRIFRLTGYVSQLRTIIGLKAVLVFALSYLWHKLHPPRGGKLARMSVGLYAFYFPSLAYFESLFSEIFFKETYYLPRTQEPIRIIDCGANIGMSLLYIKIRAPQARVTCFEPNPAARAVLEKNIEANGWGKDVQVFPYALGKEKGTVDFFVEGTVATSSGGSVAHYLKSDVRALHSYPVEVDMLSHYIDGPVDLLKIDIEGPEFEVLEELVAKQKLRHVAAVQLEYHYIPGFFTRPLSTMLSLLESEGFHTFVESNTPPHQIVGRDTLHTYMVFAWRR
ncbi:MAG: FkbM family methyltransferase [Minisyncoccia bacterium]